MKGLPYNVREYAYWAEIGTSAWLRVATKKLRAERVLSDGTLHKCAVYYEDTNSVDMDVYITSKYLNSRCRYVKSEFVPDGVKEILKGL